MKILCISDQIDPLIYSQSIKERYRDVDFIISAGDVPMEYLDCIMSCLNRNVYFVVGNHNLNEFGYDDNNQGSKKKDNPLSAHYHAGSGAIYLNCKTKNEKTNNETLLLAGVSGSLRYNNGNDQFTNTQMFFKLLRLLPSLIFNKIKYGRYLDILVTHAAPLGINDKNDPCHKGFKCFLWFMKVFKPSYLLHGHIHLYDMQSRRISQYEQTKVINVYSRFILETKNVVEKKK